MKKIKIISSSDTHFVEKLANEWLEKNKEAITVYHEYTQFQMSAAQSGNLKGIMFVYEEVTKENFLRILREENPPI